MRRLGSELERDGSIGMKKLPFEKRFWVGKSKMNCGEESDGRRKARVILKGLQYADVSVVWTQQKLVCEKTQKPGLYIKDLCHIKC